MCFTTASFERRWPPTDSAVRHRKIVRLIQLEPLAWQHVNRDRASAGLPRWK